MSLFVAEIWFRFKEYFFSVYQNSLTELGMFAVTLFLIFFARSIASRYAIRKARFQLPALNKRQKGGWFVAKFQKK
ncbi:hypothetical protein WDW89_11520 [Deltaproteobacteria bacterium TL4]